MSEDLAVGIDLGTTYSVVAIYKDGRVEIIPNDHGNRTTRSCVAFTRNGPLVGDAGYSHLKVHPKNTITGAKYFIGRWFDDDSVQNHMDKFPFEVVPENGKPRFKIEESGGIKLYSPEDISSMILKKMKETAESYLGKPVKKAVITVPAHFNESQRHKTKQAAVQAGLEPIAIINEPTAAAIAYTKANVKNESITEGRKVLIFDLGGGTLDVSVVSSSNELCEVLATTGGCHIAGDEFDNNLLKFCKSFALKKHHFDLSRNDRALAKLKNACEEAKRSLSFTSEHEIEFDSIFPGEDFCQTITRFELEQLNDDLFKKTITYVESALQDARLSKHDIDDIVLVGGSTRIPKIQDLLSSYFKGKPLIKEIHPDEVVAYGAAIWAACKTNTFLNFNMLLKEVTPLSLGTRTNYGLMSFIVKRNTQIPTKQSFGCTTVEGNQECVRFQIYQGERKLVKDNFYLGEIVFDGIRRAPPGVPQLFLDLEIDVEGMLQVSAYDKKSPDKVKMLTIGREELSKEGKEGIVKSLRAAEANEEQDAKEVERIKSKILLETKYKQMHYFIESDEMKSKLGRAEKAAVSIGLEKLSIWLNDNPNAPKLSYTQLEEKLTKLCQGVIEKYDKIYTEMFRRE